MKHFWPDGPAGLENRVKAHLNKIYPQKDVNGLAKDAATLFRPAPDTLAESTPPGTAPWSQSDMVLITYGNSMVEPDRKPLKTLCRFLSRFADGLFSIVHILPFFPYSSDDGFAVMDYYAVNPDLGDWEDVHRIAGRYRLMADLVVNHTSSRARWFENFKKGRQPGKDYYVTVDPAADLSKVIRPRTSPLLREVTLPRGKRHVWCTFSHDQVDLDYKNPDVLMAILSVVRHYLDNGIRLFRLDAVAFLWKDICTTCLHLDQTHEIIKLFRTLIEARCPRALIITETNVPSRENISYLGQGDEAHVIYNFPLPPFLLNTLVTGDGRLLTAWLKDLPDPLPGTTYLNFIASHDGIGLRPVEDWFSGAQMDRLIQCMTAFGGKISTRALNDHEFNPYEINISLWDALKGTAEKGEDRFQADRFICAHALMLSLKGIPAIYIHSLLATENDYERRDNLMSNRAVNRHVWDYAGLCRELENKDSHHREIFSRLSGLSDIRKRQPAFHPDAGQTVYDLGTNLVALRRRTGTGPGDQTLFCLYNITDRTVAVQTNRLPPDCKIQGKDLVSGRRVSPDRNPMLSPYQAMWITGMSR